MLLMIFLVGEAGAAIARPQSISGGTPQLTLQSALELADRQNLDLNAARRRREVASAGVRIAGQRPNPTVAFTALRDEPHEGLFFDQALELEESASVASKLPSRRAR